MCCVIFEWHHSFYGFLSAYLPHFISIAGFSLISSIPQLLWRPLVTGKGHEGHFVLCTTCCRKITQSSCFRKFPSTCCRKIPQTSCCREFPQTSCCRKLPQSTQSTLKVIWLDWDLNSRLQGKKHLFVPLPIELLDRQDMRQFLRTLSKRRERKKEREGGRRVLNLNSSFVLSTLLSLPLSLSLSLFDKPDSCLNGFKKKYSTKKNVCLCWGLNSRPLDYTALP